MAAASAFGVAALTIALLMFGLAFAVATAQDGLVGRLPNVDRCHQALRRLRARGRRRLVPGRLRFRRSSGRAAAVAELPSSRHRNPPGTGFTTKGSEDTEDTESTELSDAKKKRKNRSEDPYRPARHRRAACRWAGRPASPTERKRLRHFGALGKTTENAEVWDGPVRGRAGRTPLLFCMGLSVPAGRPGLRLRQIRRESPR